MREHLAGQTGLLHVGDELADFADTAAVLSLCDLAICVDTSVAHVAGALGRPALPAAAVPAGLALDRDRDASPWYPQVRLFRQAAPGDWAGVLSRLSEVLASRGSPAT